jgi:hypothetical protein
MLDWLALADASEFDPAAVATDDIQEELSLSGREPLTPRPARRANAAGTESLDAGAVAPA